MNHPKEAMHVYDIGVNGEVSRIESFQDKNIKTNIMILSDINIDMFVECDQIAVSRRCRTMPIYREILEEYGLCVMNKKPMK